MTTSLLRTLIEQRILMTSPLRARTPRDAALVREALRASGRRR